MASPVTIVDRDPRTLLRRLTRTQLLALAGVGIVALIAVAVSFGAARTPEYAVAFSNLSDEDGAAIVAKLKESKIPYELGERGTIRVPSGQEQEVRLLMAGQGLPAKGSTTGFELFSQPHFGMTEFAEKINYQRALEGELSRTIARLDAVENARVHVVVPEPSLFTSQQKEATASVVLQLKPGRKLDPSQVQGITQLVGGSVEGLKPQNVTIMDTTGAVLSDPATQNDPARQSGSRAEAQRALEARLASDVKTMLTQVLGPERAIVRVSADMNWDQYEASSETYSPEQKAPQVRSQREVVESSQGGSAAGGVPGTDSNIPTYPAQQGGNSQSQAQRRDVTTNYELSRTVEKTVRQPGGVKRLSVAVALDADALQDPSQADALGKLVATAAGLDLNRGDVVTLTSLPFSSSTDQKIAEVAEAARQRELILSLARIAAMVLGPLLVAFVIIFIMRRGRKSPARANVKLQAATAEPQALPTQAAGQLPPGPPADQEQARRQKELATMAENDPVTVAQLIRTWLQEDRVTA